jgi:hypothetical protein
MSYIIPTMPPVLTVIKGGRKGPKTPHTPTTLKLVTPEPKVSDS